MAQYSVHAPPPPRGTSVVARHVISSDPAAANPSDHDAASSSHHQLARLAPHGHIVSLTTTSSTRLATTLQIV